MEFFKNHGITARFMASLAGVNHSTITRYINDKKIKPIASTLKRNMRYDFDESRKVLKEMVALKNPIDPNKKIHAFYNFKGGTGKTSLSYQISTHLALLGYNVLVVDTDAQSHLTVSFGLLENLSLPTIYDGLVNGLPFDDLIINVKEGIDLIPANLSLTKLEVHIKEKTRQENVVKRYMTGSIHKYDFVIFDSNPNITTLNRNILSFANFLNIICETHPYSVHGMMLVIDDLVEFYSHIEQELPEIVIVPNKYEDRSTTSAEAMSILVKNYEKYMIPNFAVRKSEDFPRSAREQLPLSFFCKANSIAFEDMLDYLKILVEKSSRSETLI